MFKIIQKWKENISKALVVSEEVRLDHYISGNFHVWFVFIAVKCSTPMATKSNKYKHIFVWLTTPELFFAHTTFPKRNCLRMNTSPWPEARKIARRPPDSEDCVQLLYTTTQIISHSKFLPCSLAILNVGRVLAQSQWNILILILLLICLMKKSRTR